MSATNRGTERNAQDFYSTPESAFKPLLEFLPYDVDYWEPAQGDGRLVQWLTSAGRRAAGADLSQGTDFLKDTRRRQFIITNPPFSIVCLRGEFAGVEGGFLPHALSLAPEVMFLLRLNYLGARYRRDFFRAHEPSAIFVLSERPRFHGASGTDACEYGWFYWGKRWRGIKHL
jgi:hypothetical protein